MNVNLVGMQMHYHVQVHLLLLLFLVNKVIIYLKKEFAPLVQ